MYFFGFPGSSDGKESASSARDPGSIPGSGRSLGEGNGNPLQYSWTGEPDRLQSMGVTKSRTQLSDFTFFSDISKIVNKALLSNIGNSTQCSGRSYLGVESKNK